MLPLMHGAASAVPTRPILARRVRDKTSLRVIGGAHSCHPCCCARDFHIW
jgi:hypothetical protein